MDTVQAAELLLDLAKAIAAFQETLVSGPTKFDVFLRCFIMQRLQCGSEISEAGSCALEIFVGRGKCHFCHPGLRFTNGEFANAGMRDLIGPG